jgi:DNA invertase Pin-like site-specific DNA recombinase
VISEQRITPSGLRVADEHEMSAHTHSIARHRVTIGPEHPATATLLALGVAPDRIYVDHGMSRTKRDRPGLDQALASVRTGDTLVVPKLDRLARSVPDARDIADTLAKRGVTVSLGGRTYDPDDPMGKMFFNILNTFAEFEVDLIRMRTREGMGASVRCGEVISTTCVSSASSGQ